MEGHKHFIILIFVSSLSILLVMNLQSLNQIKRKCYWGKPETAAYHVKNIKKKLSDPQVTTDPSSDQVIMIM